MAVKKKSPAKKVAKKAPAKRTVKKVAKKSVAKKAAAKRVVKKSATKKAVAKKAAPKKKVAKKAAVKRVVKKASVRSVTPRVNVFATPVAATPVAPASNSAPKPTAKPKQGTSSRVVVLVVAGIVILAAIVWSKSGSNGDDAAAPAPSISASATPSISASATPSESASAPAVSAVEAPSKFVALKSTDGLKLRWLAPMAIDGLTGYNVEIRANGVGDWTTIASVPADQLTQNVTLNSAVGWTQFRITSVYSDGQMASYAKPFGIPGEFK
ncbi:unannotated protein [freshwater metagenome]|uniref:Unannotated protein n=1 Tax=freshwater metagenome TaxID=449393 RepID=A0A6J6YS18_9ZZZZ|nr:hypothetical protein [Actinomycetota bacterium]MSW63164.1 hypothetical protein [Actinomycetota bacterium]MSX90371.1 hypothetical protein [Actinomycetota bacterium]MSZ63644.1 hypothetical protein [Actinomycetota bacterium]MTA57449.1 hypothetical protein [Actinomycetota bacterium]